MILVLIFTKFVFWLSRTFNLGSGLTWPGHITLFFYPDFIEKSVRALNVGCCLISGTNGKTTSAQALAFVLSKQAFRVVSNPSGANLLNGIASALISQMTIFGKLRAEIGVFEVDEALLPEALKILQPRVVVLLNLFRDQLDRYGEVDTLVSKWRVALATLSSDTAVFINGDDPSLAYLGSALSSRVFYFGVMDEGFALAKVPHHADSTFCWQCGLPLDFRLCFLSHMGKWSCPKCGRRTPTDDFEATNIHIYQESMTFILNRQIEVRTRLLGLYNVYNLLSVLAVSHFLELPAIDVVKSLQQFLPHFGRQESFKVQGVEVKILLSKNPTGFNENLRLLKSIFGPTDHLLLVLNDGIADGQDVSWIYDVDFEEYATLFQDQFFVSGDRALDLSLRLKYADLKIDHYVSKDLDRALKVALEQAGSGSILYILPTYTAMLSVRRILLGRRIG